jgi:hypothetical protein
VVDTDVSEKLTISVFRAEDWGKKLVLGVFTVIIASRYDSSLKMTCFGLKGGVKFGLQSPL